MKYIYLLLLIALSIFSFAQNWSPILTNEKMNYQHSDSAYISHTIWVDSTSMSGDDSLFFLNRIVKDVPGNPEIALRNQPQFLKEIMIKEIYGLYSFIYPDQYWLSTLSNVGASWTFDLANDIDAEITDKVYVEVFGVMDSIKIISIADGNEMLLSKNFGLLKFPDYDNGGYFELAGIQGTEFGESIPGFWEIYDLEVGDIFQDYQQMQYIYDQSNITRKFAITSKSVTNNSYSYIVDGIYHADYNWGPPESYLYTDELTFTNSNNHPSSKFPGQIYLFPDSVMPNSDKIFAVAKVVLDSETGLVHKHFGNKEENYIPYETNLYYEQNENNDTLLRFEYASLVDEPCGLMGIGFGETIGDLYRTDGCFEYWDLQSLVGYIKDGDTVGVITPDSLLLVGINSQSKTQIDILLSPNPVKDKMSIKFLSFNEVNIPSLDLMTLAGEPIKSFNLNYTISTISFSGLPNGIYIYSIKSGNEILKRGKIVKQ